MRHRVRERQFAHNPVHVVLRSKFKPLRSQHVFPTLRQALARATRARPGFRVVHFSVQEDHLHLIVEAADNITLSRGMQGLAIRVAKQINILVRRSGKVWADRFYSRPLVSPRTVKRAIGYVLKNFQKHGIARASRIDPYSSAPYFNGFRDLGGRAPYELPADHRWPLTPRGVSPPQTPAEIPVSLPSTWLAASGWRRGGKRPKPALSV